MFLLDDSRVSAKNSPLFRYSIFNFIWARWRSITLFYVWNLIFAFKSTSFARNRDPRLVRIRPQILSSACFLLFMLYWSSNEKSCHIGGFVTIITVASRSWYPFFLSYFRQIRIFVCFKWTSPFTSWFFHKIFADIIDRTRWLFGNTENMSYIITIPKTVAYLYSCIDILFIFFYMVHTRIFLQYFFMGSGSFLFLPSLKLSFFLLL